MNSTQIYETKDMNGKHICSRMAVVMTLVLVIAFSLQFVASSVLANTNALDDRILAAILISFISMYLIALPIGSLLIKRFPGICGDGAGLNIGKTISFFFMTQGISYIGNIIGTILSSVLSGGNAQNAVMILATSEGHTMLKIVCMVIIAPLLEELVFRKLIIDRTRQYSEKGAVIFSAVVFGLYHGNLYQLFYTVGIGLLWGYIYLRTERIWYSYLLHVILNFQGLILSGLVLKGVQLDAFMNVQSQEDAMDLIEGQPEIVVGIMIYAAYTVLLLVFAIVGIVLLIKNHKKWEFTNPPESDSGNTTVKGMCLNIGMGIYAAASVALMCAGLFL